MSRDELPLLPLAASLHLADRHFFSLSCRGCQRMVDMGVRRAVRLANGQRTEDWLARLRCIECGSRGASIQFRADTRNAEAIARDGPLPVCQEE
ncbi:hypothetical protein [Sabulicella glaciei]|uniref:Uncharacterized protein n=1 Tax=Sabulicella glaciei TaxID=2984948 RepID=A0ABT3NZL3_9PROT|nr:hypothetical protein [Roseococcus sp. MDT2-1-1]MCW8087604.1 hypothetical protein [Roseococcus sp. MDT2-1-1]